MFGGSPITDSVISFNSAIPEAPSFLISYFGFRFTAA